MMQNCDPMANFPRGTTAFGTDLSLGLYLVATPLGNARDITLRAIDVLTSADVLAAEDTRVLRRLMDIHGIALGDRPLIACHDHNASAARGRILRALEAGQRVALTSDAGTPLIADPGYEIVQAAREAGYMVTSAPGPTAAIAALSVSGLATDRFFFAGFAPPKSAARLKFLQDLPLAQGVGILYESPKRIEAMLGALTEVLGPQHRVCVARELTKKFEQVETGPLAEIAGRLGDAIPLKGEFVLLIDKTTAVEFDPDELKGFIKEEVQHSHVKDVAARAAALFGIPKKEAYALALAAKKEP